MTIVMYPSQYPPWEVKLVDGDKTVYGSADSDDAVVSGITVAGDNTPKREHNPDEVIVNEGAVLRISLPTFSTKGSCEIWSSPAEPFSVAEYLTLQMYIKSSIPPSMFDEFYFFIEDSLGKRRRYALKNEMVGKFNVSATDIFSEDDDFNISYITKAGFVLNKPVQDITSFQFILLELSMSELRQPHYCKPEDIIRFMGLLDNSGRPFKLTQESNPSYEDICNHIIEAEDFIDAQTRTSFRVNRVKGEIHDEPFGLNMLGATNRGMMGMFNLPALTSLYGGKIFTGVPVSLVRRDVKTIDYSLGDKVEVRRIGTIWVEVPEEHIWQDHQKGILWIRDYIHMKDSSVRVTYRWGKDNVPSDITKACKLQAAVQIVSTDWYRAKFPVTEDMGQNKMDVVMSWTWQIKDILKGYQTQISVGAV